MDRFWTVIIVLVVLWAIGFFALPVIGPVIHVLLLIAVLVILYHLATGRRIFR